MSEARKCRRDKADAGEADGGVGRLGSAVPRI